MAGPVNLAERAQFRGSRALTALPARWQRGLARGVRSDADGQRLDPEIQLLLAVRNLRVAVPVSELSPEQARARLRTETRIFGGPPEPVRSVRELTVDGGAGPLRARHYAPDEPGPRPLLVFLHGGGFTIGDLDTHDGPCRTLCRHSGAHLLAVDYRLAPEHRFPAAVDDAVAAFGWAHEHAAELGADPERVGVGGDSAGGNLSAVVAQRTARAGGPTPALQLLIYPPVDRVTPRRSLELFADGYLLTRSEIDWYHENYTGSRDGHRDEAGVSPLRTDDLSGLAPALVVSAAFDPLRDEGEAYAEALDTAGTPVVLRRFPGLVHGFLNMGGVTRCSQAAIVETAGATRAMFDAPPSARPAPHRTSTSRAAPA